MFGPQGAGRSHRAAAVRQALVGERLAFINKTSVKTKMAKPISCAPRGRRLVDRAPFGNWRTQTSVGTLRHDQFIILSVTRFLKPASWFLRFDMFCSARFGGPTDVSS
jgi:hypothetical protein